MDVQVRNPELEQLRNEVLVLNEEDEKNAKNLAKELSSIHAAYLFCGCGRVALAKICSVISSTPVSSNVASISSWKDLASNLGLTFHQICCIENYKYSDYTENVIKTYAQKMNATLDRIIMALCQLKRFDAITTAKPHLKAVEKFARREQVARTEEEDNGYYSIDGLESEEPTHDGILRPSGIKYLKSQLHITLRNLDVPAADETVFSYEENKVEENFQQASPINRVPTSNRNRNKLSMRVMLTFAKDGEKLARQIAVQLRKPREKFLPIGVLILDDYCDLVEANPELFIIKNFPKMDYVLPIVTPKYLDSIEKNPSVEESIASAIDTRYVQMIHTLMSKHFVANSCRNDKFRTIISDDLLNLVSDKRFKRDPVLQAYTVESNLEKLAVAMLKRKGGKK